MDKRALTKIKELASFIVDNRSEDDIKKAMTGLNRAKASFELRSFFLNKLLKKNYDEENKKPLFTVDEYVEFLFPDGSNWKELRNLLLIAIYQKLHETNKKIESEEVEENDSDND